MMKRLSLTLAGLAFMAGCATSPPQGPQGPGPGANNSPAASQPQNTPGQTQPLGPRDQRPQTRTQAPGNPQTGGRPDQGATGAGGPSDTTGSQAPAPKAPPQTAAEVSSPAVMSLLGRADTLAKNGNMDDSAATLERALDLDPRNPFIYQRLAAVRLAQEQAGQAEQLAMKSNSLAGDNPFVAAGNWRLIAEARKSTGDAQGAQAAQSQAVNFRQSAQQYGP